jgi:hypothetical protein
MDDFLIKLSLSLSLSLSRAGTVWTVVFITDPITKLFALGEGDSGVMCYQV